MAVRGVVFDVGNVLFTWDPRFLYERLIDDDRALDAFLREVVTHEWHFQHDAGRPFAETSAELVAAHPQHRELIELWGPRFNESLGPAVAGMIALVEELDAAAVPLFAITNFSDEFWAPFRDTQPVFDRFRDIVVSGTERLVKPHREIYELALRRFGMPADELIFIDDRAENVAGAEAVGMRGHLFRDAATLRAELRKLKLL
ncbi:HAD family phosphatase [Sphingomonas sp. ID1715]|uniref:HAD family hydrolase n=1 Tax=Sphingomonas sp. ID1715 TaxID=1656898 RepID=UPI001488DD77|nr:HAD family phosphatase [Sphingomonas sp. ID1715]